MIDLEKIRADFPALENWTWFQNGGVSITPRPVAETHIGLMQELYQRGPMHIVYPKEEYPRREATLERIARFMGAEKDDIALMRGVSEAFITVLHGLDWKAGDEVIITADEEAALLLPCLTMQDKLGVRVRKLPLMADPAEQLAALEPLLNERTRLVAVSHVGTDLGFRLPVQEMCARVAKAGALSFVDMAHSAGLWPISLREMGCDFAGVLSYKWMYAPYASGFLYIKPGRLDTLALHFAGGRAEDALDFATDAYHLHDSARRFQYGPWSWPLLHAWSASLDYLDAVGVEAIWERTAALTTRLKKALAEIPQVHLLTPLAADHSAALVAFEVKGWDGSELAKEMRRRYNIVLKGLPGALNGQRASLPFFLKEEEVDALAEALATMAAETPEASAAKPSHPKASE